MGYSATLGSSGRKDDTHDLCVIVSSETPESVWELQAGSAALQPQGEIRAASSVCDL